MSETRRDSGRADQDRVLLALAESNQESSTAPWIGPIVALGAMARRYVAQLNDRQLVIALSVPQRDFAAVLLGCGWIISALRHAFRRYHRGEITLAELWRAVAQWRR